MAESKNKSNVKEDNPILGLLLLVAVGGAVFFGLNNVNKTRETTESNPVIDAQTVQSLQTLAVAMGAVDSDSLLGKNSLDLVSDIKNRLDSALNCNCTSIDETEWTVLNEFLTDGYPATLAKIKEQDAFVKQYSGTKLLVLKTDSQLSEFNLPGNESPSTYTQTLQMLQSLAVDMGATSAESASGKSPLDLISDIQIQLDSAQSCNLSTLDESETTVLDNLLTDGYPAILAKIKTQDAFVKQCSGSKILVLKKE